ncbi:LysE family translocator [Jatrophihabitans sp.]|uniref:LysE family translocator n=1 Tax=Jatrophihabitans sp. TaxID=1932789 RepID=UPI0030C65AFB|nr:LysE family translocator [Jatrophihabitans sp.]
MLVSLGAFAIAATLIVLLPGPDTLVVIRGLLRGGRSRGLSTTLGVLCGLVLWVAAASLGLSAVLRASKIGYDILRAVGAAYLIWLGVLALRTRGTVPSTTDSPRRELLGSGYVAGLLTDLLNPKVGVFFVTFLPSFVPQGYPVGATCLLFGAIFVVLTGLYFAVLLALAQRVTGWMTEPRIRRRLDTVTGTVLVGLGLRLAID